MAEAGLTERLQGRAERAGLLLAPALAARLAAYVALLLRWNEHMNLTALRADDQGLDRLVVEPLLAERRIPRGAAALVDIGSGGGSPAIPIRIARPRLVVRLVEARERKAAFLREAVRQLNLDGVVVEPCRYEELCERPEMHGAHDVLTVRGVRVDERATGFFETLVRPGGVLVFFGGMGVERDDLGRWRIKRAPESMRLRAGSGVVVVRTGVRVTDGCSRA